MASEVTAQSYVRRSEVIISSELDAETVMMDIDKGLYYGLNGVASRIWTLIEQPTSVEGLCDELAREYDDVSRGRVEDEVLHFLQELADKNIVEVVGAPRARR